MGKPLTITLLADVHVSKRFTNFVKGLLETSHAPGVNLTYEWVLNAIQDILLQQVPLAHGNSVLPQRKEP